MRVVDVFPQSSQPSSLTEPRISASAAGVRGFMIHLKGTGYLLSKKNYLNLVCTFICDCPYDSNPGVNSGLSLIMLP